MFKLLLKISPAIHAPSHTFRATSNLQPLPGPGSGRVWVCVGVFGRSVDRPVHGSCGPLACMAQTRLEESGGLTPHFDDVGVVCRG